MKRLERLTHSVTFRTAIIVFAAMVVLAPSSTSARRVGLAVIAASVVGLPPATGAQQPGVTRTDLQRHDLSVPGREVIQVRVELAPGVSFPRHSHPGEELIYVLEGSLEYQIEDKPPVTLKAGEVLFVPAGTIHAARNVGSVPGAELATYIVEKGKPLLVPVKP